MLPITELQFSILRVLWDRGSAGVNDVHEALRSDRPLAPTTVATLLTRMEKRGLVRHFNEGRRHVYEPQVSETEVRTSMLDAVSEGVFDGDVSEMVCHLLSARDVSPEELQRVRETLAALEDDREDEQ